MGKRTGSRAIIARSSSGRIGLLAEVLDQGDELRRKARLGKCRGPVGQDVAFGDRIKGCRLDAEQENLFSELPASVRDPCISRPVAHQCTHRVTTKDELEDGRVNLDDGGPAIHLRKEKFDDPPGEVKVAVPDRSSPIGREVNEVALLRNPPAVGPIDLLLLWQRAEGAIADEEDPNGGMAELGEFDWLETQTGRDHRIG